MLLTSNVHGGKDKCQLQRQLLLISWLQNPTTWLWPFSTTVVSPELFLYFTGPLWGYREEMASTSLTDSDLCSCGWEPEDVSHCQLMPFDKVGLLFARLHSGNDHAIQWLANLGRWTGEPRYERRRSATTVRSVMHTQIKILGRVEFTGRHRNILVLAVGTTDSRHLTSF